MIGLALAAMLLATPPEAPASDFKFDRACMDDNGRDLCRLEAVDALRTRLGAPAAETLAREGVEGVRVFAIDGYGRDQPMVAILWKGEGAPTIEARTDRDDDPSVLTFNGNSWHRISTRALLDLTRRSPVRQEEERANSKDEIVICLHAWVTVIEAIDDGRVHRRIRNACGDDAVFEGGFQLATLAVNANEACRAVEAADYRNDWPRLRDCVAVQGPNVTGAAAVLSLSTGDMLEEGKSTGFLAEDAVARFGADEVVGPTAIAAAWRRFAAGASARHWVRTAKGEGERVEVEGFVIRYTDDTACRAPSRQSWGHSSGRWRLASWTVGDCRPVPGTP